MKHIFDIRNLITLGFGLILIVFVAVSAISLYEILRVEKTANRISTLRTPTAITSTEMVHDINKTISILQELLLTNNTKLEQDFVIYWLNIRHAEKKLYSLSKNWTNPENIIHLTTITSLLKNLEDNQQNFIRFSRIVNPYDSELINKFKTFIIPQGSKIINILEDMSKNQQELLVTDNMKLLDITKGFERILITLSCFAIIFILWLGVSIRHRTDAALKLITQKTSALEQSELKISSIINNIVDGIINIDAKGNIIWVNTQISEMFGYRKEEMLGHNVTMLMPDTFRKEHNNYINSHLTSQKPGYMGVGHEYNGLRKDNSTFPMEIHVSETIIDGKPVFTGIIRDITKRKQIDNIKKDFISTVSHELRTPLTSIRGALGLLTGGAMGSFTSEVTNMLNIAMNNSERLLLLINDILDIEKIESGNMEFNQRNIDLDLLLKQSVESNQEYVKSYGVKLTYKNKINTNNAQVYSDKERLLRVMANLISNAAKFSPEGEVVEVSLSRHENNCYITVTDHGQGIPTEFQPRIFEKFSQSDSSDTRQKGGTGLGLNITKAIIEKLGGKISFTTEICVGTTFTVTLPATSH